MEVKITIAVCGVSLIDEIDCLSHENVSYLQKMLVR